MRYLKESTLSARFLRRLLPILILGLLIHALVDISIGESKGIHQILFSLLGTLIFIIFASVIIIQLTRNLFKSADRAEEALEESRRTFQAIFDNTFQFTGLVTTDGILTEANKTALDFTGAKLEDVKNKLFWETHWWRHSESVRQELKKSIQRATQGEFIRYETTVSAADGSVRTIDFSIKPVKGENGDILFLIPEGRDITDSKRILEELERYRGHLEEMIRLRTLETDEARTYLGKIIDSVGNPIFVKDRQHRWVLLNDALCEFMGYRREELIGKSDFDFFPREEAKVFWDKDEAVFSTGKADVNEEKFTDSKGLTHTILTKKMLYKDKFGQECIVGIITDITERKRMEEELRKHKDHLEDLVVQRTIELEREIAERKQAEAKIRESEEKFRAMFETSPSGMALCELDGTLVQVNQGYLNIIGYTHEETLKLTYWDLTPKEYDTFETLQLQSMAKTGKYGPYEKEYINKAGARVPVLLNGALVTGADGKQRIWSMVMDISERKKTHERLVKEKVFTDSAINSLPGIFYLFDTNGRFLRWNRNFEQVTDYSFEEIAKMAPQDFFKGEERALVSEKIQEAFTKGQANVRAHLVSKSGKKILYFFTGLRFESDGQNYLTGMGIDLSELENAEYVMVEQHRLLRALIDNIPDSIYVKDLEGRKILTNRSDLEFMGAKNEADVLGKTDAEVYPKHLSDLYNRVDQVVLREGIPVVNLEETVESSDGVKRCLLTSKIPLKDDKGRVTGLVGIGRDITERKSLEVKLLTLAHYDTLTQIPNRALFFEKAELAFAHAKRAGMQCAVLFIDLDNFKSVNDILGHFIGDELVKDTAAKLSPCIRETDVLARLGGDEFVILLNDLKDTQGVQQTAERIREQFNVPRVIAGNNLFITVSIGISIYPNDGETLEELLKKADTAMYAAKAAGRNACFFFDRVMNQSAITRMQVERGLREALEKKELALFYQPIVSVSDGKVRGFEALLRWFRVKEGLVLPDEFIPIAEETGLIIPIGEWVLNEACRFNKKLMDSGYGNLVVSVNVSVAQLRRKSITDMIKSALTQSGLPAKLLEIEVTESMFIQSFEAAVEILNYIKNLGAQVSLDDFGTGYSSLVHLQQLPIANLKIDRLFIKQITDDGDHKAMIPAIIDLAHKLNLNVVAEGVESDAQLKKLAENSCDYYQGYLLSKPMPEDQVALFLDRMRSLGYL